MATYFFSTVLIFRFTTQILSINLLQQMSRIFLRYWFFQKADFNCIISLWKDAQLEDKRKLARFCHITSIHQITVVEDLQLFHRWKITRNYPTFRILIDCHFKSEVCSNTSYNQVGGVVMESSFVQLLLKTRDKDRNTALRNCIVFNIVANHQLRSKMERYWTFFW